MTHAPTQETDPTQPETEDWVENLRMLSQSASAVVPQDGALDRVRAARFQQPGFSRDVWGIFVEMGWLGIRVNEAAGGLSLGLRETCGLATILGRGLVPEPFIATVFALNLLQAAALGSGGKAKQDPGCLAAIQDVLAGRSIIVPAWQATSDGLDPQAGVTHAQGRLHGEKIAVFAGLGADMFAVTTPGGLALVPKDAAGLTLTPVAMHDGTFQARLHFGAVACPMIACDALEDSLYQAMLLHAGYLLGLSERAFDITLDYLRTRRQFDAEIGSFQALQHRATEILVQMDLARAAIDAAAAAFDQTQGPERWRLAVLRARTRAGGLARLVAREAVQMHGAIGYTDAADIGLFVRKAMVEAAQFAPEYRLRAQFMALREAAA